MSGKKATKRRRVASRARAPNVLPPDLTDLVYTFSDAYALVAVAHKVMVNANYGYGPEESVLCQGVAALKRVRDQLDEAEGQLVRFLKAKKWPPARSAS
jgi:hypothetical protein